MLHPLRFLKAILSAIFFFIVTVIFCSNCIAQDQIEKKEAFQQHHQFALVLAHAEVFQGRDENGNKQILSMPSWGIDYTYQFHPKWAVGLHTDIIVEKFEVKENLEGGGSGETIERSYPVAPAIMGIYKPNSHWSFSLGMGGEFAKEGNFALTRVGVEYGAEIPKEWEVFGAFSYDFKWNAYDTWTLGIGIAKSLEHKRR